MCELAVPPARPARHASKKEKKKGIIGSLGLRERSGRGGGAEARGARERAGARARGMGRGAGAGAPEWRRRDAGAGVPEEAPALRGGAEWEAARGLLVEALAAVVADGACEPEAAEVILERAFGWGGASQRYWRKEGRKEQQPCPETVRVALEFLASLDGIDGSGVRQVLMKFPLVVGLSQETLQASVAQLKKRFALDDETVAKTIVRRPDLLGVDFDCERLREGHSCKSLCSRCFSSRRAGLTRGGTVSFNSLFDW